MNVGLALVLSVAALLAAYFVYGRLVGRWLGIDPGRPTPATTVNDGQDYVPTKPAVLFGHHYASIAAAGPIVGPTLAVLYGFLPAWLWIILGVIFIGAVHDFVALFLAVREGGKSVAEVARATLGTAGFVLYVLFALMLCVLVSAAFLGLAVKALTSHYALGDLDLPADQEILRTAEIAKPDGTPETRALTGGIATVSVIVVTIAAPFMGWLLYKKGLRVWQGSAIALAVCAASVWIGFSYQIHIDPTAKVMGGLSVAQLILGLLLLYCFFAAWLPVWFVLQPRDFVNVHLLYAGLAAMAFGVVACGFAGVTISAPPASLAEGAAKNGAVWPFLFVTIACGACSGAHGLVCGGTTCKQLASERHAPAIGYGAMLLEALLGLCVIFMIVGPMGFDQYRAIVWPDVGKGDAVRGFALAVGKTLHTGFSLPVYYGTIFGILLLEGFVLTTVDTIVRLSRYLLAELWSVLVKSPPAWLLDRSTNTLLAILAIAALAFTNGYELIWPVFGAANQLLAALTLVAATVWLVRRSRKRWFVVLPAVFMTATTVTALVFLEGLHLFPDDPEKRNWTLSIADGVLLALAAGVLFLTVRKVLAARSEKGYNPAARN
ncbi:MAG: carbon starvation protein A [Planctomycetes bacterium]|nr:carbon starvation protein A [Planctomycetota bacterium]